MSLALADLKGKNCKNQRGIKGTSGMKKAVIIDAMVALVRKGRKRTQTAAPKAEPRKRQRKNPGLLLRQK